MLIRVQGWRWASPDSLGIRTFDPLTTFADRDIVMVNCWKVAYMLKREPIEADAVYSREESAELLGVSLSTVKRLIAAGQLEASRPDSIRRIFIKGSSILRMLEETKIETVR
jgi:excisionase family DNA binding protein